MIREESRPEHREKEKAKRFLKTVQGHASQELIQPNPQFGRFLLRLLADNKTRQYISGLIERS